jgi:hypothetical protein
MTTVNVTHVKGCVEDLEIGEGTVQQIRNGRIVTLTKLGASSIPWSQDPVTGTPVSIRERMETLETELAASVAEAKYWAEQALSIVNDRTASDVIDDSDANLVKTWSSSKVSAILSALSNTLNALTDESNKLSTILNTIIDDSSISSTNTWSSSKVSTALADKADKDAIFSANSQTVTENFTIQTGQNAMSIGPTLNFVPSAVVTVETGASWTVI